MLLNPGKKHTEVDSYRSIALLLYYYIISKLFKELILKRLELIIEKYQLVPSHQFEFHSKHSTINQKHSIK